MTEDDVSAMDALRNVFTELMTLQQAVTLDRTLKDLMKEALESEQFINDFRDKVHPAWVALNNAIAASAGPHVMHGYMVLSIIMSRICSITDLDAGVVLAIIYGHCDAMEHFNMEIGERSGLRQAEDAARALRDAEAGGHG